MTRWIPITHRRKRQLRCRSQMVCGFFPFPFGFPHGVYLPDGSKVEAQTPEGTRVGTPSAAPGSSKGSGSRGWPSGKGSYASALKAKQTDWHLEFSMDDHPLPLDLTIYGAIHQHELRKKKGGPGSALPPHLLWQGVYTIKFKKVPGPAGGTGEAAEPVARSRSPTPSLSSLPEDAPHAKILRLLRVLHKLNVVEAERQYHPSRSLPESAFVNNKLSAKLTRQLEEPMIVARYVATIYIYSS